MDGAEMHEVEIAARDRLGRAVGHVQAFNAIEVAGIDEIQKISERYRARINVGIVALAHFLASLRASPVMWARRCSCVQPSRSNISNMAMSSASRGLPSISCRFIASSRSLRSAATSALESF